MNSDFLNQFPQALVFGEAVEPMLRAYRHSLFSFVGIIHSGETVILRARLGLSVESATSLRPTVGTRTLRAGQVRLNGSPKDIEGLVSAALSGAWLPFSQEPPLKLLPESTGRYGAYYENSLPSRERPLRDPERLVLSGAGRFELFSARQRELDRELNEIGFNTLDELMRAYGLQGSDQTTFEVTAESVARIDADTQLRGTHAEIAVRLARGLEADKFRLTVRDASSGGDANPQWISGAEIKWTEGGSYLTGSWGFELPVNSIIDCRAVYAGRVQDEVRLLDPRALPNRRRMVLSVIDPELGRLQALLTNPKEKERDDFEAAVALLFQMLGFAPAHIGSISGMTQEPDIFVAAPGNGVLIVECTTGVPDDEKITKLVSRAVRLRAACQGLQDGPGPPEIIMMLITPRFPGEVVPIREKAEAHGVLVLCRPDIEQAIARTQFEPDAKEMLQRWRGLPLLKLMTGG
jgi:hypothetical protein